VNQWLAFFASLDWSSSRYDSTLYKVADFVTINTKVIGSFTKNASVELGVRNLTDKNNELIHGLPTEGRTIFVNLKGTF
jgi:outer membrane cobalamin receptor